MKLVGVGVLIAGLATAVGSARADPGQDLLKKSGCTACHAIDKKVVGPSYLEVAAKYKDDPKAPEMLAKKIKLGGSGVWGPVAMPPNMFVSDADMKTLVTYILTLKK